MAKKTKPDAKAGSWKQFFGFLKTVPMSWGWIVLSLVLSCVYYLTVSMVPGSTAELYAGDFSTNAIMGLVINLGCNLILSLSTGIAELIATAKAVRSARKAVWKRMMHIKSSFYNENESNKLLSAVTSDTEATVSSIISLIIMIPSLMLYLVMCLGQVAMYSPKLLAVLFVVIPVYVLYGIFMGRYQYKVGLNIQTRIGGLTGFLTERIRNLSLIKAFTTEKEEVEKGLEASKGLYKAKMQFAYINGAVAGYTMITEAIAIVAAVLWASMLLRNGEIELEAWLAFFLFVPMINTIFRQFSLLWTQVKDVQGRAARMSLIMDAPQEEQNETASAEIADGDISFEHVSFGYAENEPVINDVTFTIPTGKSTAIIGASGSGKTTILKLIEKLYTPNTGTITVGEEDLSGLNLKAWRDKISYVAQDATVFSGTIQEVLTYGIKGEVSREKLDEVTKLAGIYDYIMANGGYEAELSLWGSKLSGGQRQRLVIARELIKDADILLLDEPTSALDAETAAAISATISQRFQGKTIITVTHELNFIMDADQIVVLNNGKITGCGDHSSLMASCVDYKDLVEGQSYQEVFAK